MMRSLSLVCLLFVALTGVASAQLKIDITNGNPSATPIAVVPFGVDTAGLPPETDVAAVITADFNRSGQFRGLPRQDIVELPTRSADVKFDVIETLALWICVESGSVSVRPASIWLGEEPSV